MSDKEWIETRTAQVRLREDGILEVRHKDGSRETLETATANMEVGANLLSGSGPRPLLVDVSDVLSMTPESRDYYARSNESMTAACRVALLAKSRVSRVIGNIFLGLSRSPGTPTKMFTNKEDALAWLKEAL